MRLRIRFLSLMLLLELLVVPVVVALASNGSSLTLHSLKNAEYYIPEYRMKVKLRNGEYRNDSIWLYVKLFEETAAFGDLNGDGKGDAVVVIGVNTGGNAMIMRLVAMKNKNGVPVYVDSIDLGDRTDVRSVSISSPSGIITVSMFVHGPNDPMCCPSVNVVRKYVLDGDRLVEVY